jgi:multisubunit Na+/H+ antiporter MnhE subunit
LDQGGAVECGVDTSCYVKATIATINAVTRDIDFWSQIQIATLVATVVFGVVATIMIAHQGDENRYWTRPVGIIATALVTGIASLTASLHVPDSIDKLIDIRRQFTALVNNFEYDIQRKIRR